jgi:hypothetical protein
MKKILLMSAVVLVSVLSTFGTFSNAEALLTEPASYDFGYTTLSSPGATYVSANGASPKSIALFERFIVSSQNYYVHDFSDSGSHSNPANFSLPDGFNVIMNFSASDSTWIDSSPTYTGYYPEGNSNPIGSSTSFANVTSKVFLQFENNTLNDYHIYLDVDSTSSTSNWEIEINGDFIINSSSNQFTLSTSFLNVLLVPARSTLKVRSQLTTSNRYFDAWYAKDLGPNTAITDAYDAGLDDGIVGGANMATLMSTVFGSIGGILSIQILNNITLGTLALFPLLGTLVLFIKKLAQ